MSVPRPRRAPRLVVTAVAMGLFAPAALATGAAPAQALDLPPVPISLWHDLDATTVTAQVKLVTRDWAGDLWYFDSDGKDFGRIDDVTHLQTIYPSSGITWAIAMVGAPDGTLWFSDPLNKSLGELDPRTGAITFHALTGIAEAPTSLAATSDGSIWFGDNATEQLGRIDPTGVVSYLAEPTASGVLGVAAAPDGRVFYAREGTDGVGVYDPATGSFSDSGAPAGAGSELAVSRAGEVWVSSHDPKTSITAFSRITPSGTVTTFPVTAPGTAPVLPADLTEGENADIYFLDPTYGFGTVDATGAVSFSRLDGTRTSIALDGQGHVWVNERFSRGLLWS